MARTDKQLSYEERYKDKMEKYKEVYKTRTDFASKFKLDLKKTKGLSLETIVNNTEGSTNNGSAEKPEGGDGVTIEGGSELGRKIAKEAIQWVGKVTYVFGAADVEGGKSDCSGFTSYVFNKVANVNIGRATTAQNKVGTLVKDREDALPGDLIMFQNTYRAGVSHVGIVVNWPNVVHCGSSKGVAYAEVKSGNYYDEHFLSIRRVISDNGSDTKKTDTDNPTAKAIKAFATTSATPTNPLEDVPDEYGMESFLLNGKQPTTTPGSPADWVEPPLHWFGVGATYKPITVNQVAEHIRIPKGKRSLFFHQRIVWGTSTGFKQFEKLDPDHFVHIPRHDGFEGNLYSPDAAKAFEIFRLKSKREKLEILSGFRFSPQGLISPHEAGCAIDVRVYGEEDARKLADIAWACGFRSIAIGGDIEGGGGFIHMDIGPKNEWGYDNIPAYQGPGRWSLNEAD